MLYDGAFGATRRSRTEGGQLGNHLHDQPGAKGRRVRHYRKPSGVERDDPGSNEGGVRYGGSRGQDWMPCVEAVQHDDYARNTFKLIGRRRNSEKHGPKSTAT